MSSQPNETVQEDLRNILQLVRLMPEPHEVEGLLCDIRARVESALQKLQDAEGLAIGKREQELANMQDAGERATYLAREFPPFHYHDNDDEPVKAPHPEPRTP